jgi:hypothetical protein
MSSSERRVSTFWTGKPLGFLENLCLSSFIAKGYEVELYTYDDKIVAPKGVVIRDASTILPFERVFENYFQRGTYAAFSNIFRYRLLQLRKTTWIDTDVFLIGEALPEGDYLFGFEGPRFINGAILRAPSDSPFLRDLFRKSTSLRPNQVRIWGQLGPRLITAIARRHNLMHFAQKRDVFYPMSGGEVWALLDPKSYSLASQAVAKSSAIHLWNEVLRSAPLQLDNYGIHPQSFLGSLMKSRGIPSPYPFSGNDYDDYVQNLMKSSNPPGSFFPKFKRFVRKIISQPSLVLGLLWSTTVEVESYFASIWLKFRFWLKHNLRKS